MIIQQDTCGAVADGGSVQEACLKVIIFAVSSGDASGAGMTHFSFHVLINKHFYFHFSNVPLLTFLSSVNKTKLKLLVSCNSAVYITVDHCRLKETSE